MWSTCRAWDLACGDIAVGVIALAQAVGTWQKASFELNSSEGLVWCVQCGRWTTHVVRIYGMLACSMSMSMSMCAGRGDCSETVCRAGRAGRHAGCRSRFQVNAPSLGPDGDDPGVVGLVEWWGATLRCRRVSCARDAGGSARHSAARGRRSPAAAARPRKMGDTPSPTPTGRWPVGTMARPCSCNTAL